MRSGYIYLPGVSGATFRDAGHGGRDWSSRGSSMHFEGAAVPSGYYLQFDTAGVNTSQGPNNRWTTIPLRCLSTVLDI